MKPVLKVDFCSFDAAKHAVTRWHYSRRMPKGKTVKIGVWEDDSFRGCVVFSRGGARNIGTPFNLEQTECCELTRVALRAHKTPVSRIIRIAFKLLKQISPEMRLVVSYADSHQGHHGGIYQAGNWVYIGEHSAEQGIVVNGKLMHRRRLNNVYGTSSLAKLRVRVDPRAYRVKAKPKYKYVMPLDKETRIAVRGMARDYPKRGT